MDDVSDAIQLCVTDECHRLRKTAFAELEHLVAVPRKWIRPFRTRSVALAAVAATTTDGSVAVLLRAFVLPHFMSRCIAFDGFTKSPDETWRKDVHDDVRPLLHALLEQFAPIV